MSTLIELGNLPAAEVVGVVAHIIVSKMEVLGKLLLVVGLTHTLKLTRVKRKTKVGHQHIGKAWNATATAAVQIRASAHM